MVGIITWSLLRGNGTLIGASANVVVAGIAKREGHAFLYGLLKNWFAVNNHCITIITCLYIFTLFNVKVVLHEIISTIFKIYQRFSKYIDDSTENIDLPTNNDNEKGMQR